MPAKLTLTHKLCLVVLAPLAVNLAFYYVTQSQVKQLEKLVDELANRRAAASAANNIITNEFFALQALMQYKMFKDQNEKKQFDVYMQKMHESITILVDLLSKKLGDPETASKVAMRNAELMRALNASDFKPDAENQFGSFFEDLERNRRVKNAMVKFIEVLREVDIKAKMAVDQGLAAETESRAKLRQYFDLLVVVNSIMSIAVAIYITQFLVKRVGTIGENFKLLAERKPLLPPLTSNDELEDLDQNFRSMADNLEAGRQAQLEMMQQIASSRDSLQTVIDALPSALFITDSQGHVESVNRSAKDVFGIDLNYFHENTLAKLFQLNTEQKATFLSNLLREEKASFMDLFAVTPDKELVPVSVSVVSFDNDGKRKYLSVVTDESESFKLKQAKSDFFSMISHDMRTPLATIGGVLQMAVKGTHGSVNEETADRLNVALKSTSVLLDLVNRLLQIEQIANTEIAMHFETIDLADVAAEVAAIIAPQLELKKLRLLNEVGSQSVFADRSYIQEVILNLVSNAIKYSPEGGEIKFTDRRENDQVFFEVLDQGPGVPVSKRNSIFERYKQADRKRDSKSGYGLGLAICKAIILQHGGSIGVREAKEGGSVFWFSLDLKEKA